MNRILITSVMALGGISGLSGQNGLTLQQCIDSAYQHNLTINASRLATEITKASKGSAIDLGNTTFTLSQDPTSGGSPDNSISIGQSFDFPTLYIAKARQKKSEISIAEQESQIKQTEVMRNICQTFALIQFLQEKDNILERHDSLCNAYLQIATNRQKVGATSNLDVLNARLLKQETAIGIAENKEQLKTAILQMQQYIGCNQPITVGTGKQELLQTQTLNLGNNQSQLATEKVNAAQKDLSISKQGFLPTFDVSLRWQAVLSGFNPYNVDRSKYAEGNFMGFEVGVGLPLIFAANKSKVKAAKLAVTQQQMEQADINSQIETANKAAQNNYELAKERQKMMQNEQTLADEMERISLVSYQNGEINYVEHVANMRAALDNRIKAAEAIYNLNLSEIEVNYTKAQ